MTIRVVLVLTILALTQPVWCGENLIRDQDGLFTGEQMVQTMSMSGGSRVIIKAAPVLSGTCTITTGGTECRVVFRKILKAPSRDEAEVYAGAIQSVVDGTPEGVVVSFLAPAAPWSGGPNAARLAVEITIPAKSRVEIQTAYFDIDAKGPFAEFVVSESLSKVSVERVDGATDIRVSNRQVTARDITGKLAVSNKYSTIKLENINTGDETGLVVNENGEVDINSYSGGLDLRTSYDRVIGRHLFLTGIRNRVKNISGAVALSFDSLTAGKLRVNNDYGQISIDIAGRVDARFVCRQADGNKIVADGLNMEPTVVSDSRLEFATGQEAAEVRLTTIGDGDIIINGPGRNGSEGGGR